MSFIKSLFTEKCPTCHKQLITSKTNFLSNIVIKTCPENHFKKEFHPALETYIESKRIS
ncbi:hypothetical protein [Metabacillus litoralis]|uniref:hypothetical protein n=1 Tax=Metabacillus litoralis TaxID=152268 RepID=UPI0018782F1B|nr:hypothetical protein [Metabacillus litoralis]